VYHNCVSKTLFGGRLVFIYLSLCHLIARIGGVLLADAGHDPAGSYSTSLVEVCVISSRGPPSSVRLPFVCVSTPEIFGGRFGKS